MSRAAPPWLPAAVTVPVGLYLLAAGWQGFDTQGVLWFLVFLGYLARAGDRGLCSVLFLFALAIEAYGTALGGWRYHPREPWFGLTTTNPPICIGAVYCTLEALVRWLASRLPAAAGQAPALAASRASRRYSHTTASTMAARSASVAAKSSGSVQSQRSSPACHSRYVPIPSVR